MKTPIPMKFAIFATAIALSTIAFGQGSLASQSGTSGANSNMQPRGHREAIKMVPARAVLVKGLDARDAPAGSAFQAKLVQKVHLKDGTELPSGTMLMGTIVQDDMQTQGRSKLALRINNAQMKDGKSVPVKATIVGVDRPHSTDAQNIGVGEGDEMPNSWNDGMLQVDQLGVVPGVDLHSKVASQNSGVFVSTKKDDVSLRAGSELELAIAGQLDHGGQGR